MRVRIKVTAALAVALVALVAISSLASSVSAAPKQTPFLAALVSDVGRFNDKSFNQNQLLGLNRAKTALGIDVLPLQSNSDADYIPNLTTALRRGANAIVCAGFLMADACAQVANTDEGKQREFAITDYPVQVPPFNKNANVTGLTYASQESGCLVGHMAALMVKRQGGPQVIGAVGGIKIPPVDTWIAGYQFCAKRANKKIKVLIGYSQDFVASDKCKTVAEGLIARKAKVLFQVAGQCGLGTLKAADEAKIWVDRCRRRPVPPGEACHDQRYQAGRQRRVPVHQGREDGRTDRRRQSVLRPREQRHGPRQDQPGRPEDDHREHTEAQAADHRRQGQAAVGGRGLDRAGRT